MKTKTLITDEKGKLQQLREHLVDEIGEANARLFSSMEQVRRHHYHRLGELFIQLRMTFSKSRDGDSEFQSFCQDKFPAIKRPTRDEYVAYRKRLGAVTAAQIADLPPLRGGGLRNTSHIGTRRERYKNIIDEEIKEPTRFEVERENDAEMIQELAEKIINVGFRTLSVKMHPDKNGGTDVGMRRLNAAKKLLQDALIHAAARMI
jgi:hypothetical protein